MILVRLQEALVDPELLGDEDTLPSDSSISGTNSYKPIHSVVDSLHASGRRKQHLFPMKRDKDQPERQGDQKESHLDPLLLNIQKIGNRFTDDQQIQRHRHPSDSIIGKGTKSSGDHVDVASPAHFANNEPFMLETLFESLICKF